MNGVKIINLPYSVSISHYGVHCLQQISRVVFMLNTTQVYHENRLFCFISFPASFTVVKMNQLITSVPKDFPCICFIDCFGFGFVFLQHRTMAEINPHTWQSLMLGQKDGHQPLISPSDSQGLCKMLLERKKKCQWDCRNKEVKFISKEEQSRQKTGCYLTCVSWVEIVAVN